MYARVERNVSDVALPPVDSEPRASAECILYLLIEVQEKPEPKPSQHFTGHSPPCRTHGAVSPDNVCTSS